jgi:hypothetical protein
MLAVNQRELALIQFSPHELLVLILTIAVVGTYVFICAVNDFAFIFILFLDLFFYV